MKYLKIVCIGLIAIFSSIASSKETVISLDDVVRKVSTENYLVLENALRVYQAKESIQVARSNLLPRLNFWKFATLPVDPVMTLGGMVEDIAPFLVPANWFKVEEQKNLYLATQEAYRALWSNEVMTAKALYLKILLDQSILEHVQENQKQFKDILVIAKTWEQLGKIKQGAARDVEIRILALQEDERALRVMLNEERNMLSYMMGFEAKENLILSPVDVSGFETFDPLNYEDFEFRSVDSSPEIREFDHLIKASSLVKKEVAFSFLGSSMTSRGVEGGMFDMLPVQQGLGFGLMPSMRIVGAQQDILKVQKRGVEETIKRQLRILVDNYNIDLENYANLGRRAMLTKAAIDQLFERLRLGTEVEIDELVQASREHVLSDSAFLAVGYRFLEHEDKLARLIFYGDYDKKPAVIEKLKEK